MIQKFNLGALTEIDGGRVGEAFSRAQRLLHQQLVEELGESIPVFEGSIN